jgi:hypothetical protein
VSKKKAGELKHGIIQWKGVGGDRYPDSTELANRVSGVWRTMDCRHSSDSSVAPQKAPATQINNRWNNRKGIKKEKERIKREKIERTRNTGGRVSP